VARVFVQCENGAQQKVIRLESEREGENIFLQEAEFAWPVCLG
jgi:hypothetical protein